MKKENFNNSYKFKSEVKQIMNILKAIIFFLVPPIKRLRTDLDALQIEYEKILKEMYSEYNLDGTLGTTNYILGETKPIRPSTLFKWYQSVSESINDHLIQERFSKLEVNSNNILYEKKDKYTLTIITSLYKGGKYIHTFLENITNQSVFKECELIIVDANSPDNESIIIEKYIQLFPNIRYIKLEERIGIYDAWNLAIKESNSNFITNANLDDTHRMDAFEVKINALKDNPDVDVVYSDVYYSFIENLSFDVIAKGNLKTNFIKEPTKEELIKYNYPHNSPMWRRVIHDNIGYFDTNFQSAGDHEFWLRAAFSSHSFLKIDQIVTSYYNNPNGISTNINTQGASEGELIVKKYQNKV